MATNKDKDDSKQSGGEGNKQSGTSNRGFASMDPERQREIASEGGKAAHEKGTAHEFTSEEARRAGSMSHGNRQSEETSTRSGSESGKQSGSKQSDDESRGSRSGSASQSDERKGSSDKSR
jgi:general stress protein YciG